MNTENNTIENTERQEPREWKWWETDDGRESPKLTKLESAFAIGATDIEACAFADITERQLYYYQEINPDFVSRKKMLKSKVFLMARKNVIDRVKYENAKDETDLEKLAMQPQNSWAYLKSHSDEFADRVDPNLGAKMGNSIIFKDMDGTDSEQKV
jgi:hypothetical protein